MTDGVHIDPQTVLESMGKLILRLKSDLAEAIFAQSEISGGSAPRSPCGCRKGVIAHAWPGQLSVDAYQ